MLLPSILVAAFAAFAAIANAAAVASQCSGAQSGIHLIFSTEEVGIMSPCEYVQVENKVCEVLEPGSIANRAVKMYPPVGVWICAFFHGQNCVDEHEPWIQRGAGVYLPDDLKGKVGAVYCERKH